MSLKKEKNIIWLLNIQNTIEFFFHLLLINKSLIANNFDAKKYPINQIQLTKS